MAKEKSKESLLAVLEGIKNSMEDRDLIEIRTFVGEDLENIPSLPTDIPELDRAMSIGGLPYGVLVEFYGPPMSGKTWLAEQVAANAQEIGENVLWIDAEGGFNVIRAKQIGMKIPDESFTLIPPGMYGEQVLEMVARAAESARFHLIVIDSVAALAPKVEMEGDLSDVERPGLHAKMLSRGLRKIRARVSNKRVIVIFINQTRSTVGVSYGPSETTTGGKALPFYCGVRIRLAAKGDKESRILNSENEIIGNHTHCKLVKTRYGQPFIECDFPIYFVDHDRDYWLEFLVKIKKEALIATHGKTIYYPGKIDPQIKTQNVIEFQDFLVENDLIKELLIKCKSRNPEEELGKIMESIRISREATTNIETDETGRVINKDTGEVLVEAKPEKALEDFDDDDDNEES